MLWIAVLCVAVAAAPASDKVTSLPGWQGALPSTHYSGFLTVDATNGRRLHYYFVECQGKDPTTAPVVLWMNGGPGCSSMDGLLYEHGPLLINHNGTSLRANPWTWANAANMLYLEAPAGVGFSYSNVHSDYTTGDNKTAADNLLALLAFFKKFPEYKGNEFYVSGESYAGVYVPTLSQKIFRSATTNGINMKGYLVGNGVFDSPVSARAYPAFIYGHGGISTRLYNAINTTCTDYINPSAACRHLLNQVDDKVGGLNPYDFYRDCYSHHAKDLSAWDLIRNPHSLRHLVRLPRPAHPALREEVPCIDSTGAEIWLNTDAVRKALHVTESPLKWTICSSIVHYIDDKVYSSMVPLYKEMMGTYRILVYNGDCDPGCNYLGDAWAVDSIGAPVSPTGPDWAPWTYTDGQGPQTAGWVTKYTTPAELLFTTIKGAGHMVPQWRPQQAFAMVDHFLRKQPFVE